MRRNIIKDKCTFLLMGAIPQKTPVWVPVNSIYAATKSPSAINSLIENVKLLKASKFFFSDSIKPSTPGKGVFT